MSHNESRNRGRDDPLDALLSAKFQAALAACERDLSGSVIRTIRRRQRRRSLVVAAAVAAGCALTISIAAPLHELLDALLATAQRLFSPGDLPPLTAALAVLLAGIWLQLVLDDPV
jgi:hypothetical protein